MAGRSGVLFDVEVGRGARPEERENGRPFHLLILGEFGATAHRGEPVEVDRDNFEEVLFGLAVRVGSIRIRELDDFHPDRLARLIDEPPEDEPEPAAPAAEEPAAPPPPPIETGAGLLDSAVEATELRAGSGGAVRDEFAAWLDRLVAPHLVRPEDPRVIAAREAAQNNRTAWLRALLHDPRFQAVEAAWRSLWWLVRRLETSERLRVYVADVKRDEAPSWMPVLMRATRSSLVVGSYIFGNDDASLKLVAEIAAGAERGRAPFLAGADPDITGHAGWGGLRRASYASAVALATPRYLVRMPYGKQHTSCDEIEFEEFDGAPAPSDLLWGNPALLVACVAADPGAALDSMPTFGFHSDGDLEQQPCLEQVFGVERFEQLLDAGLVPVLWDRGTDRVRTARLQSIADPPSRLPIR